MNSIFEHWEFILLFLFGGAVVGVHANTLFSQRVVEPSIENKTDPLGSLSLPIILGQSDYRRGFALYLFATEMLYLILASSSTILGLTLEVLGHQNSVGALTENLTPNLLFPIVASSVVVLMSQTRPTAGIEKTFRRMAHSVAGVPRNLEQVQARIHRITLQESLKDELVKSARKRARELTKAAPTKNLSQFERRNFESSMTRVHCLYYWTIGYNGESIWFSENSLQIKSLFDSLHLEYQNLTNSGASIQHDRVEKNSSPIADSERWKILIRATHQLEHRLTIVLSLLLINQPDADFDKDPALSKLRDVVLKKRPGEHPNVSGLVGQSLLYAAPFIFVLSMFHTAGTKLWRAITNDRINNPPMIPRQIDLSYMDRFISIPAAFFKQPEKLGYVSGIMDNALMLMVDYSLIFMISSGVALFARKSQTELRRWNAYEAEGIPTTYPPVAKYLYLGLIGYLLSTACFLVWKFLVHNFIDPWRYGSEIHVYLTMRSFDAILPDLFLETLTAFVCVWFVLQFADRNRAKDGVFASTALRFGLGCMVIVVFQNTLRADFPLSTSLASYIMGPVCGYVTLFMVFARIYKWHTVSETISVTKRSRLARAGVYLFGWLRPITAGKPKRSYKQQQSTNEETDVLSI